MPEIINYGLVMWKQYLKIRIIVNSIRLGLNKLAYRTAARADAHYKSKRIFGQFSHTFSQKPSRWRAAGLQTKVVAVTMMLALLLPATAMAASIARGFNSNDGGLAVGMAASLSGDSTADNQIVERASTNNQDKFVGIVTTKENTTVVVTKKSATVYITTAGEAKALVTDVAGQVKKGDFLTLSPLKGYLMKAESSGLKSFGVAMEDFNTDKASSQSIKDEQNQTKDVNVASINIEVLNSGDVAVTAVADRPFLSAVGQSLTGKEVSQWQIIAAMVIFFVLLVAIGSIIYSAVHSTIEALGRNPLAHADIYKQLLQVVLISIGVLAFGGIIIYVILWA